MSTAALRRIVATTALGAAIVALGAPRAEAINNGSDVPTGTYGEVAYITNGSGGCTGALIRPEWVLTAGHCVNALRPYLHTASFGGSTVSTRRNYLVAGVRRHPSWPNAPGSDPKLDVALIRLTRPVADVAPVGLALPSDESQYDGPADAARAIGWGRLWTDGPVPTTLQTKTGTVSLAANDSLTATFPHGGPCKGDSGSPLFIDTHDRGRVVVGVLSKAGCEDGEGTYANVASGPAHDWVLSVLDAGPTTAHERPWTAGPASTTRTCFDADARDGGPATAPFPSGMSWFVYDAGPAAGQVNVKATGARLTPTVRVFESTGDTLQYDLMRELAVQRSTPLPGESRVAFTTQANKPAEKVYLIGVGGETGQTCLQLDDGTPSFPIRGVLLLGGFRTQDELNGMTEEDMRNTLIVELTNHSAQREYQAYDNDTLAGMGAVLVALRRFGIRDDAALRTMTADDMRNTLIVELDAQTGAGRRLQAFSNMQLVQILLGSALAWRGIDVNAVDDFTRGVLLLGGFRTQHELNAMTDDDMRNTLIVELTNHSNQTNYQAYSDSDLAGAGAVLVALRELHVRDDPGLRTMSSDDQRNTLIVVLDAQTGLGRQLQGFTNLQLGLLALGVMS